MKILHIEHSKMIRQASRDVIESLGHEYIEATTIQETYQVLKKNKIDLVITGLELDDVDGEALVESLSKSEYSRTPVVVLTSYDNLDIRKKLFQLGVVDYQVKKNFTSNRLKAYIESIQLNEDLIQMMRSLKIAVIDDSVLTVKIIQNIFELNGIVHADYYYNASTLLESDLNYDIYVIDLILPETTGEALIGELKLKSEDCIIILISSTSNYKTISHALNSGADDFIVKPFDANTFLVRIKNHIKQYMLLKALEASNEKLLKLSITDGLTEVYNHKYIVTRLEEECSRASRYNEALSIILFDLDNFKKVNDTYGHQQGDEVLTQAAATIKRVLRESDVLGRYGGEEFLVILPCTSSEKAYVVADKIRHEISMLTFDIEDFGITISGGVSTFSEGFYSQLIMEADMKLLEAKKTGKNKII
ncbi:MAG: diguanylate cyclase [Clostridiales bacterium]|nr:diguanylate cyclase [Clostridiales bacterium]